ncbi:hypothetical protein DOY81_001490 [Sarcophaga bullata]|nr:hypothetical protein DOY81_001490 [Sarcophaga bullata]
MYKLIAVLLFILVVSKTQGQGIDVYYNSFVLHTDTYINLNRQQHAKYLQEYDDQIKFSTNYAASLKTIEVQGDMIINNLNEMNERLNHWKL